MWKVLRQRDNCHTDASLHCQNFMPNWFRVYLVWAVCAIAAVFIKDKASVENLTHVALLVYLPVNLWLCRELTGNMFVRRCPKIAFILAAVSSAVIVEGCYMITAPVFDMLLVTFDMPMERILKNYLIDLAFTLPAYFIIYLAVYKLVYLYSFTTWEYSFIIALGQTLGDGGRAFLLNPLLLLFLPYIMLNYQAISLGSFLMIKDVLHSRRIASPRIKVFIVAGIVAIYYCCGTVISMIGKLEGYR